MLRIASDTKIKCLLGPRFLDCYGCGDLCRQLTFYNEFGEDSQFEKICNLHLVFCGPEHIHSFSCPRLEVYEKG